MADQDSERGYEVGKDEAWFANIKRTYDEYQAVSLDHMRSLNQLGLQSLANNVETANMVAKQAIRHADHDPDQPWFRDLVKSLALEIAHGHEK